MNYFCNFVNLPPHRGESGFPPSIVDDRDAEPISSIVARMTRGQLVLQKSGYYDSDQGEGAGLDDDGFGVPTVFENVDGDLADLPVGLDFVPSDKEDIHPDDPDDHPDDHPDDKGGEKQD